MADALTAAVRTLARWAARTWALYVVSCWVLATPALAAEQPDAELRELSTELADLEDLVNHHPLACWRAWHRTGTVEDEHDQAKRRPRTSQRDAMHLLATKRLLLWSGGNRSGKTEMARVVALALVLGSDHPDARAFWQGNGLDPDLFPKGPGRGFLIALTSDDSLRYHRPHIEAMCPPGAAWRNRSGRGEAVVRIPCPGHETPAELWFKTERQGRDGMQGDAVRVVVHDEEGPSGETFDECETRLADFAPDSWHIVANTPLDGLTWVYGEFVTDPQDPPITVAYFLNSFDNPYLSSAGRKKLLRGAASLRRAKTAGAFVVVEGAIYPEFSRQSHVVPDFDIPAHWRRFSAIDFGTRNPFACVWGAIAAEGLTLPSGVEIGEGTLVIYREHYQPEKTLAWHVARMRALEEGEDIEASWADPEDAQQLLSLRVDHGMDVHKARKAVRAGIDAVAERLAPGPDSLPGLVFLERCRRTVLEHESYKWITSGRLSQADKPDKPLKRNDHTCDCVRYLVFSLRRYDWI